MRDSGSSDYIPIKIRIDDTHEYTGSDITAFPVLTKFCSGANGSGGFSVGSAVCAELKFEVPNDDFPKGAKVELFYGANLEPSGVFRIYRRSIRGGRCSITAKDLIALADKKYTPPESGIINTVNLLLGHIGDLIGADIPAVANNFSIPADMTFKGNIRDVLGWCAASQGLNAYAFGTTIWVKPPLDSFTVTADAADHSPVEIRSAFGGTVGKIRLKRSDNSLPEEFRSIRTESNGTVTERLQTAEDFGIFEHGSGEVFEMMIPFANSEIAESVHGILSGQDMGRAFYCRCCKLSSIPRIMDSITFSDIEGESFRIAEMSLRLTGGGIFGTLSSEGKRETEGRYINRTERSLNGKLTLDSGIGGLSVTSNGEMLSGTDDSDVLISVSGGVLRAYRKETENEQS